MKAISQLAAELKLTPEQAGEIERYFKELVVQLLENIKQDNLKNFDETIEKIKTNTA